MSPYNYGETWNIFYVQQPLRQKNTCIQTFKFEPDMPRIAFKMFLKPGYEEEYRKRHSAIWPELKKLLSDTGICDYSIFWDKETNILFAVQKSNREKSSQEMGVQPIVQKWWDYMADIMEVNNDNSPISIPLEEMFYME